MRLFTIVYSFRVGARLLAPAWNQAGVFHGYDKREDGAVDEDRLANWTVDQEKPTSPPSTIVAGKAAADQIRAYSI